jgi:hypothetical protein
MLDRLLLYRGKIGDGISDVSESRIDFVSEDVDFRGCPTPARTRLLPRWAVRSLAMASSFCDSIGEAGAWRPATISARVFAIEGMSDDRIANR